MNQSSSIRRVLAPCKVNLTLDVGPRRSDGYHDIDSVVATFLPADELEVTATCGPRGVTLDCDDTTLPTGSGNLAFRAADEYLSRFLPRRDIAVHIRLAKRLPSQAGLGGGSSDAAAVLRVLRRLYPDTATPETLAETAAAIGSDVPLFLRAEQGIHMSGRGERIASLPAPLPALHGVLVKPAVGVPTADAYARLDSLPDRQPGNATKRLLALLIHGTTDIAAIGAAMGNDFEAAILPAFPAVADVYQAVADAGAVRTLLCGSGSALFGLARDAGQARNLTETLYKQFPWVEQACMTTSGGEDG